MNLTLSLARIRQLAPLMIVLVSAVVAVGAYLQALDYPFVSDDTAYITTNTKLTGLHLTELWRLFTEPYNGMSEFLPLRELSYWLDITLFGMNPAAFRVHNIILYLLCLPLVYGTTFGIWRYFRPADVASAPWAAAAVTALFALHPALVESVVWISGRKYVLPNLFSMLALWLAVSAKREHGLSATNAAATLVAFVAVMLSKSSYAALAPVIAMLWVMFWFDIPAPNRRRSQLLWPLAILVLAGMLVLVFIASSEEREPFYFGIEAVTRTLAVIGWLARLAVSPESRHFIYQVLEDPYFPAMVVLGAVVLAAAMAGIVISLRKRFLEGFALFAFLLFCMPYMQLIPYAPPSLVQDRFLSLAVWPVVLLIVALAWHLKTMPRIALLLVISLSWGYQTIERPRDWRSYATLLDIDMRAYPGYYMPAVYKILSVELPEELRQEAIETASSIAAPELRDIMTEMIKVDYAVRVEAIATGNPQEAMALLQKLFLEMKQQPVQIKWNPLISNIWKKRRMVLANEWQFLASHFPDDELLRYNVGLWMLDDRRYKNAVVYLRAVTESQRLPDSVRGTAFKSLGLALMNSGHIADAEAPLRAALEQIPPDLRAYCSLTAVYKQSGRLGEAARAEANCPSGATTTLLRPSPE
jgi:protein O-mannosyl-transferase